MNSVTREKYIKMPKICVLGAGIVGLSTALAIQEHIPDAHVTIVAEKFFGGTTSEGTGGIFRCGSSTVAPDRNTAL